LTDPASTPERSSTVVLSGGHPAPRARYSLLSENPQVSSVNRVALIDAIPPARI
jgi:hypothetical protein